MQTPEEFFAGIEEAVRAADLERATQLVDQAHATLSKEEYERLVRLLAQMEAKFAPQEHTDVVVEDAARLLIALIRRHPVDVLARPLATDASGECRVSLNHTVG